MLGRSVRRLHLETRHLALSRVVLKPKMLSTANEPFEDMLFERQGCAGVMTMNRPKALNSLNMPMIEHMLSQLKLWENDPDVSTVIIKGAGGKAFCAGGDIRAVAESGLSEGRIHKEFFREEYKLNYAIANMKTPYIALIDGVTMGGGVGVSIHGYARVATEKTLFAMPETAIGFFPDVGGGYFLPRLNGSLGMFLALTGERLKGASVLKAGVATHFVEKEQMESLEGEILSLESPSPERISQVLKSYHDKSLPKHDAPFSLEPHLAEINRIFALPTIEEIMDELIRVNSEWSMKVLQTLEKMSPVSMKITMRQLQTGAKLELDEVLKMEYRLSQRFMIDRDFYEGVDAVLVRKDFSPHWNPAEVEDVSQDKMDAYFDPLSEDRELKL